VKKSSFNVYLTGAALGIFLFVGIVISTIWSPSIWDDKNQWLVRLAFYSVGLFFVLASSNWRFRTRSRLWIVLGALVAVHTVVVLTFINRIRNLSGRGYITILFVEVFVGLLVLDRTLHGSDEDVE
jgi:hypothetical protein